MYEITIARTEDELHALEEDWKQLQEETGWRNPFVSAEWTLTYWRAFWPGARPFVVCARRDGRLAAVAPLRELRLGPFRILRFIGDPHSDTLDFLSLDPEALDALLAGLADHGRSWDLAFLRNVTEGTAMSAGGGGRLRRRDVAADQAPYLPFRGRGFEELRSGGPKQIKASTKRRGKFERAGGTVERLAGANAVDVLDDMVEIERASWKAREGGRLHWSPERIAHFRAVAPALGDRLEVWLARLDGEPIAYLVLLPAGGRVGFYTGAYKHDHRKHYAGGVMHSYAIERAVELGCTEYDFLNGGEPYKLEWTEAARTIRNAALHPRTARGYAAYLAYIWPRWALREFGPAQRAVNAAKELRERRSRRRLASAPR
jgi:CelD/BcsL family acetyltransferase involved in cellulose biosynthesis